MKKVLSIVIGVLVVLSIGYIAYNNIHNKSQKDVNPVLTVEDTINEDMKFMADSVTNDFVFFESRVILPKPFNELDEFSFDEVTNVFQYLVQTDSIIITPNVYMFVHRKDSTIIDKHPGAFITDDKELYMDSIKVNFNDAFKLARQSNFAPSKSEYITLRHGFGPNDSNPFYTIGNDEYGHLWVDAVTGDVMDSDPTKIKE